MQAVAADPDQARRSVGVGLLLGPPVTFVIVRAASHWLPGASAGFLWLAAPATTVLAIGAFASAAVPAWRDASLDPVKALRAD
jgi:ABC-type antimicrobial peptide transport system permease subunit